MSVQVPLFEKGDKKPSKVAAKVEEIVGEGFDVRKFVENFEVLVEAAGGVAEVRRLVLSLAVRGAFTNAECFGSEVGNSHPFRLPKGWAWQRLADCAQVSDGPFGSKLKSSHYVQEPGFRVVRLGNIGIREFKDDDRSFVTKDHFRSLAVNHLERGDIVVASLGNPPGRACLVPDGALPAIHKADCFRVRICAEGIEPAFLVNVLNSDFALSRATELHRGDTRGRITLSHLRDTPMPLPPLAEQKRIVAKVDQLMSLCDELEAKQTKKRETGARLTKSALDALTSAEGPDEFDAAWKRVVENFDVLIDRAEKVGELRQSIVDLATLGCLVARSPGDRSIPLKRDLPSNVSLPQLPTHWVYVQPDDLSSDRRHALTIGPFGSNLLKSDYREAGVPLVFVREITAREFGGPKTRYVSEAKASELDAHSVRPGDLLITKMGTPPGETAIYPEGRPAGIITADCIKWTPHLDRTSAEFLQIVIGSSRVKAQMLEITKGVAHQKVSLRRFRDIWLPMPPLVEQQRIVTKVAHLMKICDLLEERLRQAEDRACKLVEAVVQELVA